MKLRVEFGSPPSAWDDQLLQLPAIARYEQSSQWAVIAQQIGRGKPIYLKVHSGEQLIASLLCFDGKPWDAITHRRSDSLRHRLSGQMRGILSWHWGPTFFVEELEAQIAAVETLLDWIGAYAEQNHLYSIRGYLSEQSKIAIDGPISEPFTHRNYTQTLWGNFLVDLSQDEESLWRNLKSSARKAVNKAKRMGLQVREINRREDFEKLWLANYREYELAADRKVNSPKWFRPFWELGREITHRYFIAENEKKQVMAVIGMNVFNGTAREFNSAMNPEAYSSRLPAQDLLHWEMLLAARQSACLIYNLSGVDPNPQSPKAAGIKQFKAKWGGEYVEYPRFTKHLGIGIGPFRW